MVQPSSSATMRLSSGPESWVGEPVPDLIREVPGWPVASSAFGQYSLGRRGPLVCVFMFLCRRRYPAAFVGLKDPAGARPSVAVRVPGGSPET